MSDADRFSPVIVIGSINWDLILRTPKIPAPGETVLASGVVSTAGGKSANQAWALGRLRADVKMIGVVGKDHYGEMSVSDLVASGVDVSHVRVHPTVPTGLAVVHVDPHGENAITVAANANEFLTENDVRSAFSTIDAPNAVVVLALESPMETVLCAADLAQSRGYRVVLNPAPSALLEASLLRSVDYLVPNEHEVAELGVSHISELLSAGVRRAVIVTNGSRGVAIHQQSRAPVDVPAFRVPSVDTTGAGDAFVGALSWALSRHRGLDEAVRCASAAGALATLGYGARGGLVGVESLHKLLNSTSAQLTNLEAADDE